MKKALSLSLAAIMLLTMIPMGAIGIFAEENVIEIGSVDEWNAVAGSDLAGKTIKLTADFGGTEGNLAELTPLTMSTFTGNFDGAGHTISYVTSTAALVGYEIPDSTTVEIKDVTIAHSTVNSSRNYDSFFIGRTRVGIDLTFYNVDLVDCTLSVTGGFGDNGGLLGSADYGVSTVTFEQCDVDLDVIQDATAINDGKRGTGLFFGRTWNQGCNFTFTDCTATGTIDSRAPQIGGLIGRYEGKSGTDCTLNINNVYVDVTGSSQNVGYIFGHSDARSGISINVNNSTFTGTLTGTNRAGLIGHYQTDSNDGSNNTITIRNTKVLGTINVSGSAHAGMLFGHIGSNGRAAATTLVENTLFDGKIIVAEGFAGECGTIFGDYFYNTKADGAVQFNNCVFATELEGAGAPAKAVLVNSYYENTATQADNYINVNFNNCVTTYAEGTYDFVAVKSVTHSADVANSLIMVSVNGGETVTVEKDTSAVYPADDSILTVDNSIDLTKVKGQLDSAYAQVAAPYGDTFAVRFITASLVDTDTAEISVVFKDVNGEVVKTFDSANFGDVEAYDKLTAYNKEGATINSYEAKDFGAQKFFAFIIRDIPVAAYTVEVTASYVTEGGVTITDASTFVFDANGAITNGATVA